MLLQREASALNAQPPAVNWPVGGAVSSEQLSLELHQVEREIGKRTREIAMVSPCFFYMCTCRSFQCNVIFIEHFLVL